MSRVGKKPIPIPSGVKVNIESNKIEVQGPKGKLSTSLPAGIRFELTGSELIASRASESNQHKALHGLVRSLVANAVKGVTEGFKKELEIVGIGYRAELKGKSILFSLGYSHPIEFPIPSGIEVGVDRQTRIVVSGIDRQKVGQTAANIRSLRKPDPYKNKGVRYAGEVLKKKAGKTGAK
ncbi:MAG: 50S ribosomal protein L6 [Acidobacteriota bacterium]